MKIFTAYIHENRYGLGIILLAAIFLLPFLGAFPLIDPDEPVYGQTAREMLAAGDWLSPRIYGQFWYDKPPLFYWLEMISYSLFGISDYTSRLPSAVMGIATVATVYVQSRAVFNKHIAFRAALILLTSVGFIYIAKAAVTDMTLVFTLTLYRRYSPLVFAERDENPSRYSSGLSCRPALVRVYVHRTRYRLYKCFYRLS